MPDRPASFRQKLDGKYWISRMRDQDKTGLDPYVRWIDANEPDDKLLSKAADEKARGKFLILQLSEYDRDEIENINVFIRTCTLPYIILCSGDIRFAPGAFSVFLRAIQGGSGSAPDFIYSDNDHINSHGERSDPFFKPGWSPDTLMSFLYVGNVGVFRTELLQKIGGLRCEYGAAAYYDLVIRLTEKARRIRHIQRILYHAADINGANDRAPDAEVLLKQDALRRRGIRGIVEWNEEHNEADVRYLVHGDHLVSIIIPSKDNADMLKECLSSIFEHTRYSGYEIIIVDNGSGTEQKNRVNELAKRYGATYIYQPMSFNFSAMCNLGAKYSNGEYLLFLNDDITVTQEDWLDVMLGQAMQPHVGAVGVKLLYPGSGTSCKYTIQHAGILNLKIGPVHALTGSQDDKDVYFHRNRVTYDFSAVTGACLMISKHKYVQAGGMNERLPVAYNDVALCFRLMELGYHNCLRNDVSMLHWESASRGVDEQSEGKRERLEKEKTILEHEFPRMKIWDPCYNRNLSPITNDYSLNLLNTTKPCCKLDKPMTGTSGDIPYAIDQVLHIGDVWEITGWMSAGRWNEYIVRRYLVLENEKGEGLVFRLNRIRLDDSKLDNIRDDRGELFTPFVWFNISISESILECGRRYQIILSGKTINKMIVKKTGYYISLL